MDVEVRQLLEEASRWPELRLDGTSSYLDRVNQLREFNWSQPYEEVALVQEHVAAGGAMPVRVKEHVGSACADRAEAPALLRLHGGGMTLGSPEIEDRGSRALANALGCRVFSPAYRLAPEWPHPAAVEDCRTALRWLAGRAAELGVDPARIAVLGHSAGGMLAASSCLGLAATDRPSKLVLVEPMVGPGARTGSSHRFAAGHGLSGDAIERFWRLYLPAGCEPEPADAIWLADQRSTGGLPPVDVFTSELDPLRDEGEELAARLRRAGVAVRQRRFEGLVHGSIFYCGRVPAAMAVFDAVVESLGEAFA